MSKDEKLHVQKVKDESKRKADVAAEQEKQRLQKEEQKRIRREKRAAKRKRHELRRLKQEINDTFIAKGELRENIVLQDCENIDANHQKGIPSLTAFGGFLGQIIIAFNAISKIPLEEESTHRNSKGSKERLEPLQASQFGQPAVGKLPIS